MSTQLTGIPAEAARRPSTPGADPEHDGDQDLRGIRAVEREERPGRRNVVTRLVIALAITAVLMFPMYWMLRTSVASTDELSTLPVSLWPQEWLWQNYIQPWSQYPFARWLGNSVVIAVSSVVLTLVINVMAGYAFAKLRFPGRTVLFLMIISTLMVPVQVIMVPQFQIVIDLNLLNTTWGVVLPRLAEAFGLFMARQFFLAFPDELLEAAKIDGAGHFRTFWSIVLPLSKPLVASLIIFTFMWRWNEFVWPLIVLDDPNAYTLPVGLQFLISQFSSNFGPLLAMSFLSIVPMLIVFAVFQRYFVEGVARAGLK
ncbi:carbohydrate ABC transporter permease [Terracoccus luteus]|uniref:ABC-type glycerol-3-phosphate transport system permease component n=1 Tax=Terracoccus luteus TaxID=53356 RepID=A0A839PUK7_9MICO|nr:carbohydrate ABC transporter permease [Terracoccus luteus]MBB2986713.1 ABC-type glycerol-3-phosphate transport system permease component [Terracoccus luteus]MCP2172364.1 ABC-type glycerol-3-phosphate transport system permease component [Terracoccus luteus]